MMGKQASIAWRFVVAGYCLYLANESEINSLGLGCVSWLQY